MKFILLVLSIIVISKKTESGLFTNIALPMLTKKIVDACKERSEHPEETAEDWNFENGPETKKAQCFLHCLHEMLGIQNSEGAADFDAMNEELEQVRSLDPEFYQSMSKVFGTCKTKLKEVDDPCQNAKNIKNCIEEVYPKFPFYQNQELI